MSTPPPPHRREPFHIPPEFRDWARVAGWTICALGVALFFASFIASSAGVVIFWFDPHHVFGQFGGLLAAYLGLRMATRRR